MWRLPHLDSGWRQQAPRWSAVVLAGVIAADFGHLAWACRSLLDVRPPVAVRAPLALPHLDVPPIVSAHLFGADATVQRAADAASTPETLLSLALSGIIATRNPREGFAILGEKGKSTHLYSVGARLVDAPEGRLYQIFVDRVVLEFNGHLESLRLPHQQLTAGFPEVPATASDTAAITAEASVDQRPDPPTPTESWFAGLDVQRSNGNTGHPGLLMHPNRRLQREYDFQRGDVLTAVNGVEITDSDTLDNALKGAGRSLSLTIVRAGVQQTLTVQVKD